MNSLVGFLVASIFTMPMAAAGQGRTAAKPADFTGCLSADRAPKGYKLTVTSTAPGATEVTSTVYELVSVPAAVKIDEHVGHRVTVTGWKSPAATKAAGTANTHPLQLRVQAVAHVAPGCK